MSTHDEMPPDDGDLLAVRHGLAPFAMVPEWLLLHPDVTDRAVRLYALLYRYADDGTKVAYPSRRRVALQLGCSVDTVDRQIRLLVSLGALKVKKRTTPQGDPTSSLYTLQHNPPKDAAVRTTKDVPEPKPKDESKARPQVKKEQG